MGDCRGYACIGVSMKRLIPDRVEVAIFATVAILGAAIVSLTTAQDIGLSVMSVPIFIAAALMGMRRSGQLRGQIVQPPSQSEH